MDESILKSQLGKEFRYRLPSYFFARHEDVRTSGQPDINVTGGRSKRTTWIEVKYANPDFKSKDIQLLTMCRLEAVGSALYVIYEETLDGIKQTYVFPPSQYASGRWVATPGFDHKRVVLAVRDIHERLIV